MSLVLLTVLSLWGAEPEGEGRSGRSLAELSLEELMNVEVSSVSRKEQKLSRTAAAVYVVTQEDIRRSGATSVPEALRMVPGLQVARIDSNKWAISARGFNGRFANKMLVLIDGRSIYTNLYSGVYWDQNDVVLEDIKQIEVIRGPGATMWGANAVNGVINIITWPAERTKGLRVATGGGTEERAFATVQYGGEIGDAVHYRAYTKYFSRANFLTSTGTPANDAWHTLRGGARVDWKMSERDSLEVHGEAYGGGSHQMIYPNYPLTMLSPPVPDTVDIGGGYALTRWERRLSERSSLALQGSFTDEARSEEFGGGYSRILDLDFQHRFAASHRHDLMWGLDYRFTSDRLDGGRAPFVPDRRKDSLYGAFLQDDISLMARQLVLTVGSKFQHHSYSGFEVQPGVRLSWTPNARQSLWGAWSRAVRTPSRFTRDMYLDFQLPPDAPPGATGRLLGSEDVRSETVAAYEGGYRHQFGKLLGVDIAGFYNEYDRLTTIVRGQPFLELSPQPRIVAPIYFGNGLGGSTYGIETATNWRLTDKWKLHANYSWLRVRFSQLEPGHEHSPMTRDGVNPNHQVQVRSDFDISRTVEFDAALYYVSELGAIDIPSYVRLDTRVGWRPTGAAEFSFVLQNLLDDRHPEFRSEDYSYNSEIGRAAYVKLTLRF